MPTYSVELNGGLLRGPGTWRFCQLEIYSVEALSAIIGLRYFRIADLKETDHVAIVVPESRLVCSEPTILWNSFLQAF